MIILSELSSILQSEGRQSLVKTSTIFMRAINLLYIALKINASELLFVYIIIF